MTSSTQRIVDVFTQLSPDSIARLGEIYAPNARFVDPFKDVQGLAEIQQVYKDMFRTLEGPRFDIRHCIAQGEHCVLLWDFSFRFRSMRKGVLQSLQGASHLTLDDGGLIHKHLDYWDPARGIYEKLPLLGVLMRALRKHAAS